MTVCGCLNQANVYATDWAVYASKLNYISEIVLKQFQYLTSYMQRNLVYSTGYSIVRKTVLCEVSKYHKGYFIFTCVMNCLANTVKIFSFFARPDPIFLLKGYPFVYLFWQVNYNTFIQYLCQWARKCKRSIIFQVWLATPFMCRITLSTLKHFGAATQTKTNIENKEQRL